MIYEHVIYFIVLWMWHESYIDVSSTFYKLYQHSNNRSQLVHRYARPDTQFYGYIIICFGQLSTINIIEEE